MDKVTQEVRSLNMSRIHSKNTKPELAIRKLLFSTGYRYRLHYKLKGKPDIVFPKLKVAVFVHGCYWHGHGCKVDHIAKSNIEFWSSKITKNKERDNTNLQFLKKEGWKSFVIWECEVRKNPVIASKELIKYLSVKTVRETKRGI